MKRFVLFILLQISFTAAFAGYIPTYSNFVQIVSGKDTLRAENIFSNLELPSKDGSIIVYIEQEELTSEKIKEIVKARRAKRMAVAAAVMGAVSTSLNPGRTPRDAMRYTDEMFMYHANVDLAKIATENEKAEKTLGIDYVIENTSDKEIMISNMDTGLTWYVLPHGFLKFNTGNPDVANLRIANTDPMDMAVKYVTIAAGSYITKRNLEYEDDNCWIYTLNGARFHSISKETFEETILSKEEFKEYKKSSK